MNKQEMVEKINSLIQLDIDAAHAYNQALAQITDPKIKEHITRFREDHERHITDLSNEVRELGGIPTEFAKDFKGYLIEGFTALRGVTGTDGALKAMKQNEELTNAKYLDASSWDLSPAAKAIVEKNARDEEHHLRFINEALESR